MIGVKPKEIEIEIILIDDGSTNDSLNFVKSLYGSIKYVRIIHQRNSGIYSARKKGLEEASGDYILFCDQDDQMNLQLLERVEDIVSDFCPDIICANAEFFDEDNQNAVWGGYYLQNIKGNCLIDKDSICTHLLFPSLITELKQFGKEPYYNGLSHGLEQNI